MVARRRRASCDTPLDDPPPGGGGGGGGYGASAACLYLQLVLVAGCSLRGAARVLATVGRALGLPLPVPHWTTGRLWLLRVGHAALSLSADDDDDWAWLVDHSVQVGVEKCLVVLAVRLSALPPPGTCLGHADLRLVALVPAARWTGADVDGALEAAAGRVGVAPRVIVDDHGADLKAGVARFRLRHAGTAEVYDARHKAACLLKGRLERDPRWRAFQTLVGQTRCAVQQTELAFLGPPAPKLKARFMNLAPQLAWARRVVAILRRPAAVVTTTATAADADADDDDDADDVGRRPVTAERLAEKLGWAEGFADDVAEWSRWQRVADVAVTLVERQGIYRGVSRRLAAAFGDLGDLDGQGRGGGTRRLAAELLRFVRVQESQARPGERFPGSTAVLESCFGRFKQLEKQQARGGFTQLLLGFGALLGEVTTATVRAALEASRTADVRDWATRALGVTLHAQRKRAFAGATKAG